MDVAPPIGGDQNRGPVLLTVIWIITALALMIVGLKIYTKFKIVRDAGIDDFLIFLSMVLVLICTAIITADVRIGMGRHAYYLTSQERMEAVRVNLIANPFGIMAYSLPNISVAVFLVKIINPTRWQRLSLLGLTIAQSIIAGISCILLFAQCNPSRALWDIRVKATCLPERVLTDYSYFVGVYSAFIDILLAVVPTAAFWKLQLKTKTKVGLCLLMGMTAVAGICAIVKTTKLNELAAHADFTYATTDLLIWAVVEANVIIIAASIPSLRPFVISVTHSLSASRPRGIILPRGYKAHSDDKTLALNPISFDGDRTKTANQIVIEGRSETSFPPIDGIKRTTEFEMGWVPA